MSWINDILPNYIQDIILLNREKKTELCSNSEFRQYLLTNSQLLCQLWIDSESREILKKDPKINEYINCEKFKYEQIIYKINNIIPTEDLFIYSILEPEMIKIIESDDRLKQYILKDKLLQSYCKSEEIDVDFSSILNIFKDENSLRKLQELPETKERIERIEKRKSRKEIYKSPIDYSDIELKNLQTDLKRTLYVLKTTLNEVDEKKIDDNENISQDESQINNNNNINEANLFDQREQQIENELNELQTNYRLIKENLENEIKKNEILNEIIKEKDLELKQGVIYLMETGKLNTLNTLIEAEAKLKDMDVTNKKLQIDYQSNRESMEKTIKENTELDRHIRLLTKRLIKEKNLMRLMISSKLELEKVIGPITDERDRLRKEKRELLENLEEYQSNLQFEKLKFDENTKILKQDFEEAINIMKEDNRSLMTDLICVKSHNDMISAETKDVRSILDKVKKNEEELNRKLEVLLRENTSGREETERILKEYENKVEDNCQLNEIIESLKKDKENFLSDKYALERTIQRLGDEVGNMREDVEESGRKLADARSASLNSEKLYQESQTSLAIVQADLRAMRSQLEATEEEKINAENKLFHYRERNDKLVKELESLQTRLTNEQNLLSDERRNASEMKNELIFLNDVQEKSNKEIASLLASLESERNLHLSLREQYLLLEKQQEIMSDSIKGCEIQIANLEESLCSERSQYEVIKLEKEKYIQDLNSLRLHCDSQEEILYHEREKCRETVENIRNDFLEDLRFCQEERKNFEQLNHKLRQDLSEARENLRQKDIKLRSALYSIGQLDSEAKGRRELECQLMESEAELQSLKIETEQLKMERKCSDDKYAEFAHQNDKLRLIIDQLKEGLKILKEEYTKEVFILRKDLERCSRSKEDELSELKSELSKLSSDLKTKETSLEILKDNKEELETTSKCYEQAIAALKKRLYQEVTNKRLLEERLKTLKESRRIACDEYPNLLEDKPVEQELKLALIEEQEKVNQLKKQLQSVQASSYTQEAHLQTIELQLSQAESELNRIKRNGQTKMSFNMDHTEENDKSYDETKKLLQLYESERTIFFHSAQKMALDLESCRKQILDKTKENIKLQEELCKTKDKLSNNENQLKKLGNQVKELTKDKDYYIKENFNIQLNKLRTLDNKFNQTR